MPERVAEFLTFFDTILAFDQSLVEMVRILGENTIVRIIFEGLLEELKPAAEAVDLENEGFGTLGGILESFDNLVELEGQLDGLGNIPSWQHHFSPTNNQSWRFQKRTEFLGRTWRKASGRLRLPRDSESSQSSTHGYVVPKAQASHRNLQEES